MTMKKHKDDVNHHLSIDPSHQVKLSVSSSSLVADVKQVSDDHPCLVVLRGLYCFPAL